MYLCKIFLCLTKFNKKMKKKLIFIIAIILFNTLSFAQVVGSTTGMLTWSLDLNNGTLTICDSGDMPNYNYSTNLAPWHTYRDTITTVIIGDSVANIGDYAFYKCKKLIYITIPNSVARIGVAAFQECSRLTSIIIPDSVKNMGSFVFFQCDNLISATLSKNISSIEEYFFYECHNLSSVIIPDSVTTIGYFAFYECRNLTSINIPDNLTSIGERAFSGCSNLASIHIPDKVVNIGEYAFFQCSSLVSVNIPRSVANIGHYAFSQCSKLKNIDVESDNTAYSSENGVLFNKSKTKLIQYPINKVGTSYNIPNSVTDILTSAFRFCHLVTIKIPNSVIVLYDFAFGYCHNLTSVSIGNQVDSISYGGFYDCTALKHIYSLNENPPKVQKGTFTNVDTNTCILHVPIGSKNKYAVADIWKSFIKIQEDAIGVEPLTMNNEPLTIYPNPTTGQLIIDNGQLIIENIELYDVVGRKIVNCPLLIANSIDISPLKAGIYFIKIHTNKGIIMQKISKKE